MVRRRLRRCLARQRTNSGNVAVLRFVLGPTLEPCLLRALILICQEWTILMSAKLQHTHCDAMHTTDSPSSGSDVARHAAAGSLHSLPPSGRLGSDIRSPGVRLRLRLQRRRRLPSRWTAGGQWTGALSASAQAWPRPWQVGYEPGLCAHAPEVAPEGPPTRAWARFSQCPSRRGPRVTDSESVSLRLSDSGSLASWPRADFEHSW